MSLSARLLTGGVTAVVVASGLSVLALAPPAAAATPGNGDVVMAASSTNLAGSQNPRTVTAGGAVTTATLPAPYTNANIRGAALAEDGSLYLQDASVVPTRLLKLSPAGAVTVVVADLGFPAAGAVAPTSGDVEILPGGDLVVSAYRSPNTRYTRVNPTTGAITVIYTDTGSNSGARTGVDGSGTLYYLNTITTKGVYRLGTTAGSTPTRIADSATDAYDLAVDSAGNIYLNANIGTTQSVQTRIDKLTKQPNGSYVTATLALSPTPTQAPGQVPDATGGITVTRSGQVVAGRQNPAIGAFLYRASTTLGSSPSTMTIQAVGTNVTTDRLTSLPAVAQAPAGTAPTVTGAATGSGAKGSPFFYTPTITGTPTPTLTVSGSVPPGVGFNSTTGVLSGTPTTPGTYSTTITATNSAGTASVTVAITIDDSFTGLAPAISGSSSVGQTLTASPGPSFAPAQGTTLGYRWQRGSGASYADIALATASTYVLTSDDRAARNVRVQVTASRSGYATASATSAPTAVGAGSFTVAAPTVTGTAVVGGSLTCAAAGGTPGTLSYAWTRGVTPVGTGSAYSPQPADLGSTVTCTVTAVRPGYVDASASAASGTITTGTFTIGAPTITGTAATGSSLTCAPAPSTPGTVAYRWTRGATALASTPSYDVTADDVGSALTCTVSSTRSGYTTATNATDSPVVGKGTFSVGAPTITGTAVVGGTLTCVAAAGPGTATFVWRRAATQVGTGSTYDPQPADAGAAIRCVVTVARTGYVDATNQADSPIVAAGTFAVGAPTISGVAAVGRTLTCAAPTGPGSASFVWRRGATQVGTGATYDLVAADLGLSVRCALTVARSGYADATNQADSDVVVRGTFTVDAPSITGVAAVGRTLTCVAPAVPGTASYTWTRPGATLASTRAYDVMPADLGAVLTCTLVMARAGYDPATSSADPAAVARGTFTIDPPTISGSAVTGGTLTCAAAPGTLGTVSFEWFRGATSLATTASYDVVAADAGVALTCVATSTRTAYDPATAASTSAVIGQGTFTVGPPTITGTVQVGHTIACVAAAGPGAATFAWSRGNTALATTASYDVVADDATKVLTCTATVSRPGYVDAVGSADTPAVALGDLAVADPTVTGTAAVGETLTCAGVGAGRYVWSGPTGGVLGSGETYVLTPAELGKSVTCSFVVTLPGYNTSITSTGSATVTAGTFTVAAPTLTGSAVVGRTLTCAAPAGPGTASYTWTRGATPLATTASYDVAPGDLGATLTCSIVVVRTGYDDATSTASTTAVAPGSFTIGAPSIDGTTATGRVLSCAAAPGSGDDVTFAWFRGLTRVGDSPAYLLVPDDVASTLRCVATSVRAGYLDATNEATSAVVAKGTFAVDAPVVTGEAKVGKGLLCGTTDHLRAAGDTASYVWSRGSTRVAGTAGYTVTPDDLGAILTCDVTVSRAGYDDATGTADTAEVVAGTFTIGAPVLGGTARYGDTLTCSVPPGAGSVSYAWLAGSAQVGSGSSYAPRVADVGRTLVCVATAAQRGYDDAVASTTSRPVAPAGAGSYAVTLAGVAKAGRTLTASVAPTAPAATVTWQWYADGAAIAGATSAVLSPTVVQLGMPLVAEARVAVPGTETGVARSAATRPLRLRKLRLDLNRRKVRPGQTIKVTASHLLPGQAWVLRFGNGRVVAQGTVRDGQDSVSRKVRVPTSSRLGPPLPLLRHHRPRPGPPDRVQGADRLSRSSSRPGTPDATSRLGQA